MASPPQEGNISFYCRGGGTNGPGIDISWINSRSTTFTEPP
ncbi:MAG: hypothetical protein ONB05_11760 [candidate division KSB1 bacterium]|nr:hypothetical protein [candidate division KSB1 bacterium]